MNRHLASIGLATGLGAILAVGVYAQSSAPVPPFSRGDNFNAGLCTGSCPGALWAIRQEVNGTVAAAPSPGRPGLALYARAAAKGAGVAKADIVFRSGPMPVGTIITTAFDLYIPAATPINSMQLLDLECATCGEEGNPGIRLYLRNGRLRIDRSKIGIADAWVRDTAPVLTPNRWHRIVMTIRVGLEDSGTARVTLNGQEVLAAQGATIMPLPVRHIDRVQIGITANSNPVPVSLYFDNITINARPAR
ncbi:heparin lyase I family protein [Sphingomonas sp.]|uniref:heparin lyase I family protein n=1 Tax=Sphingomonas sp. TaxID=28214 RepID=UPI003D6D899D